MPARLASSRFPRKVLAADTGHPMIEHVCRAAERAASTGRLVVAADDAEIDRALEPYGREVVMTSPDHPNGTSRLAEAADRLGLTDDDVVVNVQGDEPELDPGLIDAAVEALAASGAPMGTAAAPFGPDEEPANPNIVKVVTRAGAGSWRWAVYFSRALIPFDRDGAGPPDAAPLKHVGLYAYRRGFLQKYVRLPETPLERCERLEQLRAIEHGHGIAVAVRDAAHHGIDTPEQYRAFVERWRASGGQARGATGSA